MNALPEDFTTIISQSLRILTLGRALSPSDTATLARRTDDGFEFGELHAPDIGPDDGSPFVVRADVAGRIGNTLPQRLAPDASRLHAALLAARPGAGASVLIRSPRLAAWGLARRPIPVRYFQMFGYTKAREIAVAEPTPTAIDEALAANPDTPALLLTDGRTLVWGPQASRAVRLVLSLEEAAQVTALADAIGGAKDYPEDARTRIYESLKAQTRH